MMESMKRNRKIAIGCSMVAAMGFWIVSYGHFYRGRMALGWVFAVLMAAQLAVVLGLLLVAGKYLWSLTQRYIAWMVSLKQTILGQQGEM